MLEQGDHFEIRIVGEANSQAVINRFHYAYINGTPGEGNEIIACRLIRSLWQSLVLPFLTSNYRVHYYECLRINDAAILNEGEPNETPVLRYDAVAALNGTVADDSGEVLTAPFPTYVAAGVRKVCGPTRDKVTNTLLPTHRLRGGARIGPLPEEDTELATPNTIDAALITALETAFGQLDTEVDLVDPTGVDLPGDIIAEMIVIGLWLDKEPYPANNSYLWAPVNACVINPYITSQVSRKQRFRLG